ncbi:hypothetical protein K474DRAFT_408493 [Panus rudis PR-1116 ss-1]|nr:hypothetical protein K474DRAFT_408493 [Panus rudis PR-1116 ss-1]
MSSPRRSLSTTQIVATQPVAGNLRLHCSHPSLKRTYSQMISENDSGRASSSSTPPLHIEIPLDMPLASPPSPVPTEIIEEDTRDIVQKCIEEGIKVRDYAYPPLLQKDLRAPELWRYPIRTLAQHDAFVRRPVMRQTYELHGKALWRLLDSGWVTQKEAELYWSPRDWEEVEKYKTNPLGPHPYTIPTDAQKPTRAYRARKVIDEFGPCPDEIPEVSIYVPDDVEGMYDGPPIIHTPIQFRDPRELKRRKLGGIEHTPMDDEPTPSQEVPWFSSQPPSQYDPTASTSYVPTPIVEHSAFGGSTSGIDTPQVATPQVLTPAASSANLPLSRSVSRADLHSDDGQPTSSQGAPSSSQRTLQRSQTLVFVQ